MTGEIIGRDAELSVVQAFLDRPAEGLSALVLEGDAGIGKSTLWQAGVAAARERSFQVLTSRPAEAERTLAHVVLGDLFADADPKVLAALPAPRRRAFESALLRGESDLPVEPRALGAAIVTLLPTLAGGRPLVLAIDDDQWMDASSAATLRFALRRSLRQPVLLLLSRRHDGASTTALEEAIDPAAVERLRVDSLSMGAIQFVLRHRLGATYSRPMLLRLHEASGGNPFYALELARASVGSGPDPTAPLSVPPSLERLVAARFDALAAPTRRALILVAAHGRLPVELIRRLQVPPGALDGARAASLIDSADGVVRFTHPLLASALYQAAAGDERRAAHRRLATAMGDALDRARHLALALDEPDDELAAALDSAVTTARDRGMPIAAAELAEHALRLTPLEALDDRHRRAVAVARAHLEGGEAGRARVIIDGLLAGAQRGPRRAEALWLAAGLEDPRSAIALLQQALSEATGAPEVAAVVHAGLADAGPNTHGRAWAEQHARASLRLAEGLDDDALRAHALATLATVRFARGDPHALELAERAYRLATRLAEPRQMKRAVQSIAGALAWSGIPDHARAWLEAQLDQWRDRDEQVRSSLLWFLALVELWAGRWSIASEHADEARDISVQYGLERPQDHLPRAFIALHRGDVAMARGLSSHALSLAKGQQLSAHIGILAVCDLWSGSPAAALPNFVRAEEAADVTGRDEPALRWWRAEYVEALLQLGRIDAARDVVADWEGAANRVGREWVRAQAVRCRGLIASAQGRLAAATALLDEAAARHDAVGDPFGHGRALLAMGIVRRRMRQKRRAREALEAALAGFEALGAVTWIAAARTELGRIGGRERIEGLSPSEMRVAALVANGLTNREIASTLFLGERTVASHLTHVYAKLGIRSRTELTRQILSPDQSTSGAAIKVPTS